MIYKVKHTFSKDYNLIEKGKYPSTNKYTCHPSPLSSYSSCWEWSAWSCSHSPCPGHVLHVLHVPPVLHVLHGPTASQWSHARSSGPA